MVDFPETLSDAPLKPFLKWPGGKRWLAPLVARSVVSSLAGTYFEPFLGGAAVYFHLLPRRAVLSDVNPEVVTCVRSVRDSVHEVAGVLGMWQNEQRCFMRVREMKPRRACVVAARLIYLTGTSWGGMYRVNRRGTFNVPFGNSGRPICDHQNLLVCAHSLKGADIRCADFASVMALATSGDVVYADPPYTTLGQNNGFARYNEHLFAGRDQERLAVAAREARSRGALVVVSGFWHDSILLLYGGWWAVRVSRFSAVSGRRGGRRVVSEAVLFSHKPQFRLNERDKYHIEANGTYLSSFLDTAASR